MARKRRYSLNVVIPVYNESTHIKSTLLSAADALVGSSFDAEFIVVDDGSTDGSGSIAEDTSLGYPIRVLRQENLGRIAARRAGLEAATCEYTLFLDGRVKLEPGGLAFVAGRLPRGERVWNSHVTIQTAGNPFGKFWKVVTYLVWSDYLLRPRTTSFTAANFDRYPKGTTGFLALTDLLRQGFDRLKSYYQDDRYANDDTAIIRWIASQEPIHISPQFACTYAPRTNLAGFVRHGFHRGIVFLDGHGRPGSRFFPAVVAFYPISLAAVPFVLLRPRLALATLASGMVAITGLLKLRGFSLDEAASFAALSPVYTATHGAGMWKGLAMMIGRRVRQSHP